MTATGSPPIRPGFTRQFTIYDDDDQISIIKGIYQARSGSTRSSCSIARRLSRISHAKNVQQTPQDFYKDTTDPKMARLAVVFSAIEEALLRSNALDFDDLLLESVRLLRHDAELRAHLQQPYSVPDDRRVSGHESQPVRPDPAADANRTRTSSLSAMKISRSTAGAAPTSATFSTSSATIRTRR